MITMLDPKRAADIEATLVTQGVQIVELTQRLTEMETRMWSLSRRYEDQIRQAHTSISALERKLSQRISEATGSVSAKDFQDMWFGRPSTSYAQSTSVSNEEVEKIFREHPLALDRLTAMETLRDDTADVRTLNPFYARGVSGTHVRIPIDDTVSTGVGIAPSAWALVDTVRGARSADDDF